MPAGTVPFKAPLIFPLETFGFRGLELESQRLSLQNPIPKEELLRQSFARERHAQVVCYNKTECSAQLSLWLQLIYMCTSQKPYTDLRQGRDSFHMLHECLLINLATVALCYVPTYLQCPGIRSTAPHSAGLHQGHTKLGGCSAAFHQYEMTPRATPKLLFHPLTSELWSQQLPLWSPPAASRCSPSPVQLPSPSSGINSPRSFQKLSPEYPQAGSAAVKYLISSQKDRQNLLHLQPIPLFLLKGPHPTAAGTFEGCRNSPGLTEGREITLTLLSAKNMKPILLVSFSGQASLGVCQVKKKREYACMTYGKVWMCVYIWKCGLCTLAVSTKKCKQKMESKKNSKHGQRGWYCIMLDAWS